MPLPKENLDNKTFDELVEEARALIPVYAPEWTDHNIHDSGIMFIELFAWLVEMQIYRLNRISDRSQRKFLKLLGIPKLKPAKPAKVELTLTLKPDQEPTVIPAGTKVAATEPSTGEDIIFETQEEVEITNSYTKTVTAIQSHTIKKLLFSSSGLPDFSIDLENKPIMEESLKVSVEEETIWTGWTEVEDFDASKPCDRHFAVDLASGRMTFGNGINGKIPPVGEHNITVSFCSGGGVRGNVGPHAIKKVIGELDEKVSVDNLKAAHGGEDAETLQAAILRARKDMKTIHRAVTSQDYEHLVMNMQGHKIARVKAIPRFHLSQDRKVPSVVTVVVVPDTSDRKPKPDADILRAVYWHLDKYRLLTSEVFVIPPVYTTITVSALIAIKPEYLEQTVISKVDKELRKFLDPIKGGADSKGWPFGRTVYISEIIQIIDGVRGVDYVQKVSLRKNGMYHRGNISISPHGLALSSERHIISTEWEEYKEE